MAIYQMVQWLQERIASDERGAAAVEYGLLVALIAAVVAVVMVTLGTTVTGAFNDVIAKF